MGRITIRNKLIMKYKVFFEIGKHKMQQTVEANNEHHAKAIIADSIIFYRTENVEQLKTKEENTSKKNMMEEYDNINNLFGQFFGGKLK